MHNSFLLDAYIKMTYYKTTEVIIKHITEKEIQSLIGNPEWNNIRRSESPDK